MGRARTDQGRVSRLVVRALLVLGGAVAATAVGWLVSSATAAADTLPDLTVPGTHAAPVSGTVAGVLTAVHVPATPAAVPTVPPPPAVTGALSGAVTRLGDHVPVGRAIPVTPLATPPRPQAPPPAPAAAGQSGPAIGRAAARPMPAVTTVAPIPPGPATVVRSVVRQPTTLAVLPASLPIPRPAPSAPGAPLTAPAAPGTSAGSTSGGPGLGLTEPSGVVPVPGTGVVGVVPVHAPPGRVAGRQPGITPD